jgi:hypothetical protein
MSDVDKLNIGYEMTQLDRKNRAFYDELTDEERKKFSTYLMVRWSSSVQADGDIQAYYVMSCNENLNTNFFDISQHPKLQWLCATTVSPGIGTFRHQWISPKKKEGSDTKISKVLRALFPDLKEDEIDVLRRINTKDNIKQLAREHGWTDDRIKKEF